MLSKSVLFAPLLLASPAWAFDTSELGQGGSLLMGDLMPLLKQSPQLQREAGDAAAKANKKLDDVVCTGYRFPGQWTHLGGERAGPYDCDFGEKWLKLRTTVHVTNNAGHAYDEPSRSAMKNAAKILETNPKWEWTTEAPK